VRAKAVAFIKEAKEFARAAGADKVTCCPLGDGYEFAFQADYARAWKHLVETLSEAAAHLPQVPLFIEYKPFETRGRCFVDTAAKTLCLLHDIGLKGLGVTIDFGHSLCAGENPAETVTLIGESGYPFYIHINDNDGRWDWDYFVATKHLLEYAEFLYYLQKYGYRDYLTSDTSPTRWDIRGTFEANARLTGKLWDLLGEMDKAELEGLLAGDDYLRTWRLIEERIFGLR
jgi:xylose isomerase